MPRTAEDVVADLHALLATPMFRDPTCSLDTRLAGFLSGSTRAPTRMKFSGMVLVDALSESIETLLTPDEWSAYA